ncbi:MAG TPA: nuclear transport factor 2 family protein [Pyrinomonadaceae bacterium]|nr:nuclear transport factor 2 family protein [Pyrinomonadaceae bacterium]
MKHCPNCLASYEDDTQTYCTNEGTRLLPGVPPRPQPQPTILAPSQGSGDLSAPDFFRSGSSGSNWSGSSPSLGAQTKPWSMLDAQQPPPRKSNMLVIILGSIALMVVGLVVGIMLANRNATADNNTATQQGALTNEIKPEVLLTELKDAEGKVTEANIKGDKTALDRMLAEDYIAIAADGKVYNKAQTLASTEPADTVTSWSIDGARLLSYGKDSATLTGIITFKTGTIVERQQFTDSFVKRDNRWQAFASQSTLLK